jgi:hypothetical protein
MDDLENSEISESARIKLAELSNPLLDSSILSLSNALEAFQKNGERHRQSALIQMDQAVEYILKAALFQEDSVQFMKNDWENMTYEKAFQRLEEDDVSIPKKELLKKAHSARNEAQHRGIVCNISWTRFHMKNIYDFMRDFTMENFGISIDEVIPVGLQLGFYNGPKESLKDKNEILVQQIMPSNSKSDNYTIVKGKDCPNIYTNDYKNRQYLKDSITGEVLSTTVMYYSKARIVGTGNVIAKLREVILPTAQELGGRNLQVRQFIEKFKIRGPSYGDVVRKVMREFEAKGNIKRNNYGTDASPRYGYDIV